MAAVSELSVLLFALISNIHAEQLIVIQEERDSLTFELPEEAGSCLISISVGEGKLVLWNTSDLWPQNSSVPEDLKQRLVSMADTSSYMINDLIHSDSGLYQEECWTEGKVTHEKNITLTVCASIDETRGELMKDEETKDLPCPGAADHLDVQWLKRDYRHEQKIWTRVFGDNTASVMDNDRGKYQVVTNTSALRISNISTTDLGEYTCLLMNQQQCVSGKTVDYGLDLERIYHSVEDTAVLQCPDTGFNEEKPPYWKSDLNNIDQGQHNYSGSLVDQNYSLVLTSCLSSTKTLLYRDPFGVHSTFYAVRCSALSVLLLMLCVAVVTVILRTRTRDT
ncbi:hypothetical protein NQZ68_029754 [Dissostichus eleginoides]|nr:hypothetical protein NQZ68_029754 [Dissostichus eleginoides]